MRKLALSLIMAFAVYVTAAAAQAGSSPQGTQGSSPSMQQPGASQPGAAQPGTAGQTPDMGPGANTQTGNTTANTESSKGEKKIKGCVESQNGQYVLMTKKGNVALAGQDVSAHVGHEVQLKGTWDNSSSSTSSSAAASSSGGDSLSKGTFNVTDVKMESENCKIKSKDNSGNMGTTGTGTSGSTSGTGGNSTTTPPQ
jgi:hypothetical protein